MRTCRKCGKQYQPTQHQIKAQDYTCKDCRHIYDAQWRARRRALGLKASGGRISPEKYKKWLKEYQSRPEVRKRKAEQMRRYTRDPLKRMRHEARWQARRAIIAGRLKRQPCRDCGAAQVHAHHPDYYKPLEVVWLCQPCHRAEHSRAEKEKETP